MAGYVLFIKTLGQTFKLNIRKRVEGLRNFLNFAFVNRRMTRKTSDDNLMF